MHPGLIDACAKTVSCPYGLNIVLYTEEDEEEDLYERNLALLNAESGPTQFNDFRNYF